MATLKELFEAPKSISGFVGWRRTDEDLTLLQPLEIGGIVLEGAFLRGAARRSLRNAAVMLQLEIRLPGHGRSGGQIERVCWNPLTAHSNPAWAPVDLPTEIVGSHFHDFYLNVKSSGEEMRAGNLRAARPIEPNPSNWQEMLDFCSKRFSIGNLTDVEAPPWEADLFGGIL